MLHIQGNMHSKARNSVLRKIRDDGDVAMVLTIVCSTYGVDIDVLLARSRGVRRAAFARQVAMYLVHVWIGLSLSETGRKFGRDRTTVTHACKAVESARDDAALNKVIDVMESAAATWSSHVRTFTQGG